MRKKVIAGNWKMNKTLADTEAFVKSAVEQLPSDLGNAQAIVCSPFPYLPLLVERAKDSQLHIGAQTMHEEDSGAFTGEVSPLMLKDIGVTHVIIGHSERREYFAETDETVNKKTKAAFAKGLNPIVCVGESLEQREAGETKQHVETQVKKAIAGLTSEQASELVIAYEPIWAIGTGKTASSEDANDVCTHIREVFRSEMGEDVAKRLIIQYGGSVNPNNIEDLLAQSNIDGALVGGASLEADSFIKLVEAARHG